MKKFSIFLRKKILHTIFLLINVILFAQVKEDIRYFIDKAVEKSYQNPKESVSLIQELMLNDKNTNELIYQSILAQSYAMMGDYQKSVQAALQLDDKPQNYWKNTQRLYVDYCIADQYQNLGLFSQAETKMRRIMRNKTPLNDIEDKMMLAKVYQLKAINDLVIKDSNEVEKILEQSNHLLPNSSEESAILKIENQIFEGVLCLQNKKKSEAEAIYQALLQNPKVAKYPYLKAQALRGLAQVYFLEQKSDQSIELLLKAKNLIENLSYLPLQSMIEQDLSKAFLVRKDNANYQYYRKLYEQNKETISQNKKAATSYLVTAIEKLNQEEIANYKQQKQMRLLYVVILIFVLISGLVIYYWMAVRKEKDYEKQTEFFSSFEKFIKTKNENTAEQNIDSNKAKLVIPKRKSSLSPEKENELLAKLADFEKSELFLSNQMSLPFLAAELETNTKYLSEIIRNEKEKNFNAYINGLRIQHIVNLLKTNETYLHYKVSYLAEMSGFSSHSAFTNVFKSVTGMLPNDFIQQIINQKKAK